MSATLKARITRSAGTPSEHYPADEQERNGALDYEVTITIGDATLEGGVTLYRDDANNGVMSTCGTPLDGWCSTELVKFVHSIGRLARGDLLASLAAGPGVSEVALDVSDIVAMAAERAEADVDEVARQGVEALAKAQASHVAWDWCARDAGAHRHSGIHDALAVVFYAEYARRGTEYAAELLSEDDEEAPSLRADD